jgi:hypothetical protein
MKKQHVVISILALVCVVAIGAYLRFKPDRRMLVNVDSSDPLAPVYYVTSNQIIVWRYFPRTPCSISTDNPTCGAADGMPTLIQGACSNQAVCNPLSANDKLPPNKRIVSQQFLAAEGRMVGYTVDPKYFKDCPTSGGAIGGCLIEWCRWEGATSGFGKFKNWANDRDRTAAIVAQLADK